MSEGNMIIFKITDVDGWMNVIDTPYKVATSKFIYSREDNVRDEFIEILKDKYSDHEIRVLDATKYKIQSKVRVFDEADYENDLGGVPQIRGGFFSKGGHMDLPRAGECNDKGFLIFINANLADDAVVKNIYSLMDIKKLYSYALPEGWTVITFTSELDFHLSNKIISVSSSFQIK